MNAQTTHHPVRFVAPFYARETDTGGFATQLHPYRAEDFVARFQQHLQAGTLTPAFFPAAERTSEHDQLPVLRLPLHRSFHMVAVELVCPRLGLPALDPARIISAGFVIRRSGGTAELGWMLAAGEPSGWRPAPTTARDPDLDRRLCRNGRPGPVSTTPAYTGEEVHPLRASVVTDANKRKHTILAGYLPLGGFHYLNTDPDAQRSFDDDALDAALAQLTLPWPFDFHDVFSQRRFNVRDVEQVSGGVPTPAFAELLDFLVQREHLGEPGSAANDTLRPFFEGWRFGTPPVGAGAYSVWRYLEACAAGTDANGASANPLVRWLADYRRSGAPGRLPDTPDGTVAARLDLTLTGDDTQELRFLLANRTRATLAATASGIPVPKFLQGPEDIYQLVPFARVLDDRGLETVEWGDALRSEPFRVAAPFDPEASRPALIQVPSMKDLKRGIANGVSFLTPPDTMHVLDSLNVEDGVSADVVPDPLPPGPQASLQWICSFSIPIVTFVALLLLMIIVSLLNLVLQWMPFVRICIPMPTLGGAPKFP